MNQLFRVKENVFNTLNKARPPKASWAILLDSCFKMKYNHDSLKIKIMIEIKLRS